jgi:hypothetical protein
MKVFLVIWPIFLSHLLYAQGLSDLKQLQQLQKAKELLQIDPLDGRAFQLWSKQSSVTDKFKELDEIIPAKEKNIVGKGKIVRFSAGKADIYNFTQEDGVDKESLKRYPYSLNVEDGKEVFVIKVNGQQGKSVIFGRFILNGEFIAVQWGLFNGESIVKKANSAFSKISFTDETWKEIPTSEVSKYWPQVQ